MLLRFEVSNHRSILEPVELSMIAVDNDRPAARSFDLLNEKVLTVAGIYGPNASGKSNLLEALAWLSEAIDSSLRRWGDKVPQEPHLFGQGQDSPSTYEVDVMLNGVRHQYFLKVSTKVLYESLHSYPKRRRRMLFERDGEDIRFGAGYEIRGVRSLLTPTTLTLSAAIRLNHKNFPVRHFLDTLRSIGLNGPMGQFRSQSGILWAFNSSVSRFTDEGSRDEGSRGERSRDKGGQHLEKDYNNFDSRSLRLLQMFDPSIDDVQFTDRGYGDANLLRRMRFVRSFQNKPVEYKLDQESAGTQHWFSLIGPVLEVLDNGGILLHDDIETSLHPKLLKSVVELFQDPHTNPRGAQLIFTSHDVSLLNHLNRDEVWLTEKDESGSTELVALAEYGGGRVRKSANLERAYMQGRFGALPSIDQATVHHALGLTNQPS